MLTVVLLYPLMTWAIIVLQNILALMPLIIKCCLMSQYPFTQARLLSVPLLSIISLAVDIPIEIEIDRSSSDRVTSTYMWSELSITYSHASYVVCCYPLSFLPLICPLRFSVFRVTSRYMRSGLSTTSSCVS